MTACRCGCGRPVARRGLSKACYDRWRYWGCPQEIPVPAHIGNDRRERDRLEDYAEIRAQGYRVEHAAARIGVSERTAWRYETQLRNREQAAA